MKKVKAGVLQIAYREYGDPENKTAILLHGFPYSPECFSVAAPLLAERGFHVLVPCLRGYGETVFLDQQTPRSGQQAALGQDLVNFMDALGITRAFLAGFDWGGRAACVVSALYPERVLGLLSCGKAYNIQDLSVAERPVSPEDEQLLWYQYLLQTKRGENILNHRRDEFCQYLWKTWSPDWSFSQREFDDSAAYFDNPDFSDVVLHSYRHRHLTVPGHSSLDSIESRLKCTPSISVPAFVLEGESDGVQKPQPDDPDRRYFTGYFKKRTLARVGHNVPQESPLDFADAISELASVIK